MNTQIPCPSAHYFRYASPPPPPPPPLPRIPVMKATGCSSSSSWSFESKDIANDFPNNPWHGVDVGLLKKRSIDSTVPAHPSSTLKALFNRDRGDGYGVAIKFGNASKIQNDDMANGVESSSSAVSFATSFLTFKAVTPAGHPECLSMWQQDALGFFLNLINQVSTLILVILNPTPQREGKIKMSAVGVFKAMRKREGAFKALWYLNTPFSLVNVTYLLV
ncbi:hypothetical protein M8C21_033421 [Ambrosia artemisiifolia]|uniref:Uncharacterized protein n=1 Tax=Ambrosia artemisiifolia TaxID=4212 RepID=A0AAD5C1C6_AMBAR|nr:hypothetical protein M8C21_033421 [Ambrosia artemisiifolia]